jgi:hypothetical protein
MFLGVADGEIPPRYLAFRRKREEGKLRSMIDVAVGAMVSL